MGLLSAFSRDPRFQQQLGAAMNMQGPGALGQVGYSSLPAMAANPVQRSGSSMPNGMGGNAGAPAMGAADIMSMFGMPSMGGAARSATPWAMNQRY